MTPLTLICFLLVSLLPPCLTDRWSAETSSACAINKAQQPVSNQTKVPPAPPGCGTVECQWWEQLRVAAGEVEQSYDQKEKEIAEITRKAPRANNIIGNPPIMPPDFPDTVARLDADIQRAITNFLEQIAKGNKNLFPIPVIDHSTARPIVIHREKARYTEEDRAAKIQGTVLLSLKFQSDGTITDINVIQGLEGGLNEEAIIAARKIVFLPAVKNGKFISGASRAEFQFRLY